MTDLARSVLLFLATSSVQLALFAVAGLLLVRASRASKARGTGPRVVLLLVVALPLVSLAGAEAPERTRVEIPVPAAFLAGPSASPEADFPSTPIAPGPMAILAEAPTKPLRSVEIPAPVPSPPMPPESLRSTFDVATLIAALWMIAAFLLLGRFLLAYLRLRIRVAISTGTIDRAVRRTFRRCAAAVGLRRAPDLVVSDRAEVPFLTGLFRPVVVLPRRLLDPGSERGLEFAMLHELAHLKRRDHLFILPEALLRSVYFFHPLLRWLLSRIGDEREHHCDLHVARAVGGRAAYAEFLLNEFGDPRWRRRRPLLALGHGGGSAARRVRRLVDERGPTMFGRMRTRLAAAGVAVSLLIVLALGPVPVVLGEGKPAKSPIASPTFDSINAMPTGKAGVYHVQPVFEDLLDVYVVKRAGPDAYKNRRYPDYAYEQKTGKLVVLGAIDDAREIIFLHGHRVMPWKWITRGPIEKDSVHVLLGARVGVCGADFEVDEAQGTIRFLRTEHSDRKKDYYIKFALTEKGKGGTIGNHRDRAAVRKFLGIGDRGTEGKRPAPIVTKSIGTIASPTDDPRVFTLGQALKTEGMTVSISEGRFPKTKFTRLAVGADYTYDQAAAKITLRAGLELGKTRRLFVSGEPGERHVVHFHRALEVGSVRVAVEKRRLVEGPDFKVDYAKGVVTILVPEARKPDTRFFVKAGKLSYGHFIPGMKPLLDD